jgi:hypothetical protein
MIGWDVCFEIERVEKLLLPVRPFPHHRCFSHSNALASA